MADETPEVTAAAEADCEECLFDGADKIRAGLSLLLGLVLIGIAADVLTGGRLTGRFRGTVAE